MAISPTPKKTKAVKNHFTHSDEAKKTALRTLIKFRDDKQLAISNNDLFKYTGFTHSTGYRVLRDTDKDKDNDALREETRGRPRALTDHQIDQIAKFLEEQGGCRLPWAELCAAAGLEFPNPSKAPCVDVLRKAVYTRGWRKCVVCFKYWTCNVTGKAGPRFCPECIQSRTGPRDSGVPTVFLNA
ncbi:hypothetical protein EV127DRAFT_434331 [Xylaria flabelliformis]|nr:hypothetical protein EV127DRAFT_434331 [Xylaria flabelliformis]